MINTTKLLALTATLAILLVVGCSDQDVSSPAAPEPVAEQTKLIANPMPEEFQLVLDQLADYGLVTEPGDRPDQPLPSQMHLASMAAGAIEAVIDGNYFPELTRFADFKNHGNAGFSVSWLEPGPSKAREEFYCYVYVDRPIPWPSNTILVSPYTQPIYDMATRQVYVLSHPETIIASYYQTGGAIVFNYVYSYHTPVGNRIAQLSKFGLGIESKD